jgi:hypothetical protein
VISQTRERGVVLNLAVRGFCQQFETSWSTQGTKHEPVYCVKSGLLDDPSAFGGGTARSSPSNGLWCSSLLYMEGAVVKQSLRAHVKDNHVLITVTLRRSRIGKLSQYGS